MRVGELARRTGVGVSTLRAWEARYGFLDPVRSPSGHRTYEESDVERVEAVLRLMSEGLTLPAAIARVASVGAGALPDGEGEALLFRQVLQVAGRGIWVSHNGRTRYANRRMAEIMGCSLDELLTTPVVEFYAEDDTAVTMERGVMLRAGQRLHFTQRLRRLDGSTFLAEVDTAAILNQAGRYEGAVAVVSDVTDEFEAHTRLRYRTAILDSIGEAVTASRPDGTLVYINPAAERLFGWRAADVIGTDGRALMPAPDVSKAADRLHANLLAGKRFSGRLKLVRLDRSEFTAHLTSTQVYDEQGTLLGLVAIITDETERDRLDRRQLGLELRVETLALLSAHALRREPAFIGEAVDAARRLLDADRVALFEIFTDTDALQVRAASPAAGFVDSVPSGRGSFAGYTALARRMVVVDDTGTDRRFEPGPAGMVSAIGVPIASPDVVCGVLVAESTSPGHFDQSDGYFLQGIANLIGGTLLK